MNLMKIPSREIWKNKKRSRKWGGSSPFPLVLWKKSWKRREGKTVLDFFHFSFTLSPFFSPLYRPQLSVSLSLYRPCFFCVPPAPSTSLWTFFYDFLIPVKVHTEGAKLKDKRTYHFARRSTQTWQVAPVWGWLEFSLTSFFFLFFFLSLLSLFLFPFFPVFLFFLSFFLFRFLTQHFCRVDFPVDRYFPSTDVDAGPFFDRSPR